MKKFFVIANEQKDIDLEVTLQIKKYIEEKGGICEYAVKRKVGKDSYQSITVDEVPSGTECIFCVGGDGTLIRAARDLVELRIPVIGVNRGHVGYLCELDCNTVFLAIDQLMMNFYVTEDRMMLTGQCMKKKEIVASYQALNDIVIHRGGFGQMISLNVYVNGEYLNTYSADGIIIATPTGSTAYSMSAGGPIVDPKAHLILITPINPHGLNSKCIVLDAEDEIVLEISSRRVEADESAEVSFDGDHFFILSVGDKIVIKKSAVNTKILKLNKVSFLEILRKKMQQYN